MAGMVPEAGHPWTLAFPLGVGARRRLVGVWSAQVICGKMAHHSTRGPNLFFPLALVAADQVACDGQLPSRPCLPWTTCFSTH